MKQLLILCILLAAKIAFGQTYLPLTGSMLTGQFYVNSSVNNDVGAYLKNTSATGYGLSVEGGSSDRYITHFLDYQGNSKMIVLGNGDVGIGTIDTKGYKLAVNGNMIAESVKVKLYSAWPDYVFRKSYPLKSLSEVEQFIKTNEHLPNIPSAREIREDGLNLGEMNAKLLEKIEELMLYMIEKDKEVADLKKRVKVLESGK